MVESNFCNIGCSNLSINAKNAAGEKAKCVILFLKIISAKHL